MASYIILKHRGRYSTAYAHLSRFAKGLRKGKRVNQGDIIGYVGSTGLATGPHLHYEFRVNGDTTQSSAGGYACRNTTCSKKYTCFQEKHRTTNGPLKYVA